MNKKIAIAIFAVGFILSSYAQEEVEKQTDVQNRSQLHIYYNPASYNLKKTYVNTKINSEGWSETAEWRNESGYPFVYIRIFAHVSYRKVIMRSHIQPLEQIVQSILGSKEALPGSRGEVATTTGFHEFLNFRSNGSQCAYLQGYWGDKSFGGVDIVRGAKESDEIVGNHMIQIVFCGQFKDEMNAVDLNAVLSDIDLRDAYWPVAIPNKTIHGLGFTGTYSSKIIVEGMPVSAFSKVNTVVKIIQKGDKVSGSFGDSGKIWGDIEGDTIKFEWYAPGRISNGDGEWTINEDSSELQGSWTSSTDKAKGKWNLKRID